MLTEQHETVGLRSGQIIWIKCGHIVLTYFASSSEIGSVLLGNVFRLFWCKDIQLFLSWPATDVMYLKNFIHWRNFNSVLLKALQTVFQCAFHQPKINACKLPQQPERSAMVFNVNVILAQALCSSSAHSSNRLVVWRLKFKAFSCRTVLRTLPTDEQLPRLSLWMFWTEMTWAPCSCRVFWWTTPVTATPLPTVLLFLNSLNR